MRKITGGFLFFGYLFLALTIGAAIWRAGLGGGAGAAGVLGALGIMAGLHALVTGMADR
ncbi:MAG TPA: diguanylate phosphodiesterase, partial [Brevundimonas diminuta]|nr:diguanylate phosphodiesterase [Brevundimonas diminuta]